MSSHSRRRALRGSLVTVTACLAGCVFSRDEEGEENERGRTLYESDVTLGSTASWPSYRRDARNTGYDSSVSGPRDDATVAWRYSALTEAESGVVVDGGHVYAGGLVLDGETGQRIGGEWNGHTTTPTVANGTVFVPTFDLEGRDAETGELNWTFEPDSQSGGLGGVTVADGTAYVLGKLGPSGQPPIYAVDGTTGEEEWRWTPDGDEIGSIRSPLAVADGTVYLLDEDGIVCAIDSETGEEKWRQPTFVRTSSSPVVVDGMVYFGSEDNEATALRTEDGEPQWRTRLSHESEETVAVTPDSVFATGGGNVTGLSTADGTIEWERQFDDVGQLGSPTVAGDTVYVGSRSDGTVLALATGDGTERWRVETRSVPFGDYTRSGVVDGPAVVDGVAYVATEPGEVYAIAEL